MVSYFTNIFYIKLYCEMVFFTLEHKVLLEEEVCRDPEGQSCLFL